METYSQNFLQNNGFVFSLERIPQTTFRVVECDIPILSVTPVTAPYAPGVQYLPGSACDFGDLQLTFLVDEDLKNYEEIYRWIVQQRSYENQVPLSEKEKSMVSDGVLMTMTNSSNVNRVFKFKDMFPIEVGTLHFDTSIDSPEPVTCEVTFKYSYFELEKLV